LVVTPYDPAVAEAPRLDPVHPVAPAGRWPLVGRDAELAAALSHLGAGHGVVLRGAAGVGKSRLAAELAARLDRPVVTVFATAATRGVPLGGLAPLLATTAGGSAEDGGAGLIARAHAALAARAGSGRLHLVVDDVHLLDELSATVVLQAVLDGRVVLVATRRTGADVPEPVARLRHEAGIADVEVPPLDRDQVDAVLRAALGSAVDTATLAELWRVSEGNTLLLHELVTDARARGVLVRGAQAWALTGPVAGGAVADAVAARLGAAPNAARAGLDALAVAGELDLDHALELVAPADLELLEDDGIVTVHAEAHGAAVVRFAHPLYADVLAGQLGVLARRRICRGLADRVATRGALDDPDLVRVARWRVESGDVDDVGMLTAAARVALAGYEYHDAAVLAEAVWERARTVAAAELLAEALAFVGRPDAVLALLAEAGARAQTDAEHTRLAVRRGSASLWSGDVDGALAVNAAARATVTSPECADELRAHHATLLLGAGRPADAAAIAADLADHADARVALEAAFALSGAELHLGRGEDSFARASAAYHRHAATEGAVGLGHPGIHLVRAAHALVFLGRAPEAATRVRMLRVSAVRARMPLGELWASVLLGGAELLMGRVVPATEWLERAVQIGDAGRLDGAQGIAAAWSALAIAQSDRGDVAAAIERLDRTTVAVLTEPDALRARAWAAVAHGELTTARGLLHDAASCARALGAVYAEALAWHDLVRLGEARTAAGPLTTLVGQGELLVAQQRHAQASADRSADGLADAAARFEAMGALLLAAETYRELADVLRRHGDQRAGRAADHRVDILRARCPGSATPGLRAASAVVPLSGREREVALLAAAGRSNREIAAALVLSVRTVENHLRGAYEKLGIAGRDDLPDALGA
jgi:DNA-binding CsgD family transcriptional regulator